MKTPQEKLPQELRDAEPAAEYKEDVARRTLGVRGKIMGTMGYALLSMVGFVKGFGPSTPSASPQFLPKPPAISGPAVAGGEEKTIPSLAGPNAEDAKKVLASMGLSGDQMEKFIHDCLSEAGLTEQDIQECLTESAQAFEDALKNPEKYRTLAEEIFSQAKKATDQERSYVFEALFSGRPMMASPSFVTAGPNFDREGFEEKLNEMMERTDEMLNAGENAQAEKRAEGLKDAEDFAAGKQKVGKTLKKGAEKAGELAGKAVDAAKKGVEEIGKGLGLTDDDDDEKKKDKKEDSIPLDVGWGKLVIGFALALFLKGKTAGEREPLILPGLTLLAAAAVSKIIEGTEQSWLTDWMVPDEIKGIAFMTAFFASWMPVMHKLWNAGLNRPAPHGGRGLWSTQSAFLIGVIGTILDYIFVK